MKYIYRTVLSLLTVLGGQQTFGSSNLVPLNETGLNLLNSFLEIDNTSSRIVFSKRALWPSVCNSNNLTSSYLEDHQIRIFTFYVTPECNEKLNLPTTDNQTLEKNLEPVKLKNTNELRFKVGEITVLGQKKNSEYLTENQQSSVSYSISVLNSPSKTNIFDEIVNSPDLLEVMTMSGITGRMALDLSGDYLPDSTHCDRSHFHNDIANNFCHAMTTNIVQQNLMSKGYNRYLSHLIGTSLFAIKEAFDGKYDLDDIAVVNLKIYDHKGKLIQQKVLGTVFFGGTFYLVWQSQF